MEMNLESLISEQVRRELAEMDLRDIVDSEVRSCIRDGVAKEIVASVSSVAKHMIAEEVRKSLDGEVSTNDGWGKTARYASFEELFRQKFKAAMDDKYEVKKEIEKQVSAKVQSLVSQDYKQVVEKIVKELTKSAA